ncbi:FxsA family protein [Desulfurispirillum indicum]|uniref:FxsA family protein n=1 Tax=Desulfurispirillum indicum TaxID=936456 RepID=UPI00299E5949|nr:FxsA family protein [Desulfurispirillum indicum]
MVALAFQGVMQYSPARDQAGCLSGASARVSLHNVFEGNILQLFLLFVVIPLVELFLLIRVGSIIGALNTVGIVVITAAIGAYYARSEGMSVVYRMQQLTARGELPTTELIDALMIFGGGALLLAPGCV